MKKSAETLTDFNAISCLRTRERIHQWIR